jgi:predicted O-linked N-acetylglucosamine transferase (SPINDLY family)
MATPGNDDAVTATAEPAAAPDAAAGRPLAILSPDPVQAMAGQVPRAIAPLRTAAAAPPDGPDAHVARGQAAGLRGDREAATAAFRAALRADPRHVRAMAGLAALAEADGRLEEARDRLAEAARIDPLEPELDVWAARIALAQRDYNAAQAFAWRALGVPHPSEEAARIAARAVLALHGEATALRMLRDCLAAQPLAPGWAMVLAALHAMRGRLTEALAELRAAHALAPDCVGVQAELGMALAAAGERDEAETWLRRALSSRPNDLALRNRLATMVWKAHRMGEANAILEATIAELGPDPVPLMNRALLLNLEGDQDGALATADQVVDATGGSRDALVTRLCVLPYHPLATAHDLKAAALAVAACHPAPSPMPGGVTPDPDRRLTIGLLSGNLCCHPVGWLTVAGIEALPEAEFRVAAYSLRDRRDWIARRFRARCAIWRDLAGADTDGILATIRADAPDILIDLGGFGEGGAPAVVASRAAPVQVKWVGSQCATSGLPAMDWMLTDRWETPEGFEPLYTERLLRLPDGYVCYAPPPDAPAVGPLPALHAGAVTFGCFNNLAKVTPQVLAAWSAILAALPHSRLVLRTHALADDRTRQRTEARLRAAGIDPRRVAMHGSVPHRELMAAYGEIDIALDPFPYTGGLTVCEALWMGVPVISLVGEAFAARHALSHLSNVGLADWAVADTRAYVQAAITRAQDLAMLGVLRAALREQVRRSPLCDAARFGTSLSGALRAAWRAYCDDAAQGTTPSRAAGERAAA